MNLDYTTERRKNVEGNREKKIHLFLWLTVDVGRNTGDF